MCMYHSAIWKIDFDCLCSPFSPAMKPTASVNTTVMPTAIPTPGISLQSYLEKRDYLLASVQDKACLCCSCLADIT